MTFFICIPYRTEIHHPYAFHFSKTKRSKAHKSGLDYSKIIIITKTNYLDSTDAIVDKDEYNETMINLERIKKDALDYVEEYMECMNGKRKLHKKCLIENMDFQHYNIFIKS
jgi:protein AbiQ